MSTMRRAIALGTLGPALFLSLFATAAWGQTATNLICTKCVGTTDLANQSVESAKIKNNSIHNADILNSTITSADIKNGTIHNADILDGTIRGADVKPSISLGTGNNAGNLSVKNTAGQATVTLGGGSGNVTNRFSNVASSSNGLVKAWAKINFDGSIDSCWRCNMDTGETFRTGMGSNLVDFTPLGTDISGRPLVPASQSHIDGVIYFQQIISATISATDLSSVLVNTQSSNDGTKTDNDFTVLIY